MNEVLFENQIGIVCPIKNESRYISEWLDYHYRIGVDRFYLYNNDSEDTEELEKILEPWIQKKIVVYEKFSGLKAQNFVYNLAIKNYQFDCRYMTFIDSDEFIFEFSDRNDVEDTEFRDFYCELRKFPFRRTFHDDETRLKNLVAMLEDQTFEGMLEKYLTCFHLSQVIKNISVDDRKILTRLSLDGILKSLSCAHIKPQDALLLLDILPQILKTRSKKAHEVFEVSKRLSQSLMYNSVVQSLDLRTYERILQMSIVYDNLDSFLNEELFTE